MPRLAIILWYMEYQNEPSKPNEQLVALPDDQAERDKMLAQLYVGECGDDDVSEADVTVEECHDRDAYYGDLQVGNNSGTHMFVTYAKLPGEDGPLQVVESLTSEMFHDPDDIPMTDEGCCRYWGAFEDSPVPHYRVWVRFNREPENQAEAEQVARAYFGE